MKDGSDSPAPLSQRARMELERAGELELTQYRAVGLGLLVSVLAVVLKAFANQLGGGETGYSLLLAAAIVAAWFGGLPGGATAAIAGFLLNSVIFLDTQGELAGMGRLELVRQLLFLVVSAGSVWIIASRRASRDRVASTLDHVSSMADEIQARDRRLEIMLAVSGTGFWEWDIVTGELLWSDAIFRQYGLEPDEAAPDFTTHVGIIHEADRGRFQAAIDGAIAGPDDFELEYRLVWPDGSEHWTHGAGRVFRDSEGRPLRMIGTGQDITDRRALEDDRDRLVAEERRAGEFREAFIDVISHELRTPITTILGTTEILSRPDRVVDVEVRAALLADARAEAERLHRLVEDLLVLSRVERGRLVVDAEPLHLRRLLDRVVAQIAVELPSIQIDLQASTALPVVSGEVTYVEQILRNLLENAAKYSPAGTHVNVSAESVGHEVYITILDHGPGIPASSAEHIFDLFYRDPGMARTVAGSGIGLFVCRNLAEAMGGRIEVRPGLEGGSRFTFSLPILAPDEEDALHGSA